MVWYLQAGEAHILKNVPSSKRRLLIICRTEITDEACRNSARFTPHCVSQPNHTTDITWCSVINNAFHVLFEKESFTTQYSGLHADETL